MATDTVRETAGDAPEAADAEARAHVRAVVAAARSSFFLPMWFLPRPRREAMFAVYAFCREVDDIADEPASPGDKRARLAAWRAEIDALFAGRPGYPTARALKGPVARYGLAKEDFLALIDGMEMDAEGPIRAPSLAALELYCDRVAGAVGRLSIRAFGAREPAALDVARELGQALQLTNILRDLREDADQGRLYLPRELLEGHGIDGQEPDAVLAHPALAGACTDLARLARERFAKASLALGQCARRPMRPAIAMMEIYRRNLDRLEERGWTRLDERVGLPTAEKILLVARHALF